MIFRAHPGQAECPQVLGALVMPSPTNELSPAARAQQIICSPGTNYLLRLFALLSSEASVTPPPTHTHSLTHTLALVTTATKTQTYLLALVL